jgi:serine phosphatase RsbU (regulator of sigma subunit)
MNPYEKYKNWVIGDALAKTDDIFERGKIELLLNFSSLFIILSSGFLFASLHASFAQLFLSIQSVVLLSTVLIVLKTTGNAQWASYCYLLTSSIQSLSYTIISNGIANEEAGPFLILYISFGFLLLGRKWGIITTLLAIVVLSFGIYNSETGYSLFYIAPQKGVALAPRVLIFIPLLLNVYLVSSFFRIRQKAEKQIADQKEELEKSHAELELKNQDTIASINYASRIQQAMLPTEENILRGIPLSFVLYKPRDIVCGDFYWYHELDSDSYIIVCADCTGHGVPGALMTMIGVSILNQVVADGTITSPSLILSELDKRITESLKQQKQHSGLVQDSMDLALLKVNRKNKEFTFCGAKRPAIYIHNNELMEIKGTKHTLGGLREEKKFEEVKKSYEEDDVIYLFTDGYTDQFGGTDNKKFMIKQFRDVLLKIHHEPMNDQKQKLEIGIEGWKKNDSQTDDILVIGIRF